MNRNSKYNVRRQRHMSLQFEVPAIYVMKLFRVFSYFCISFIALPLTLSSLPLCHLILPLCHLILIVEVFTPKEEITEALEPDSKTILFLYFPRYQVCLYVCYFFPYELRPNGNKSNNIVLTQTSPLTTEAQQPLIRKNDVFDGTTNKKHNRAIRCDQRISAFSHWMNERSSGRLPVTIRSKTDAITFDSLHFVSANLPKMHAMILLFYY